MSENKQHIVVFQQNGSGEKKIKGIEEYGENKFSLQKYSIDEQLPEIIDDSEIYLPQDLHCDLVLDFLTHPDLSSDLAAICSRKKIPVVASGKKISGVHTPFTWCGLPRQVALGKYSEYFGAPEFEVNLQDNIIVEIKVIRGTPCGATWEVFQDLRGLDAEEAVTKIGLDTQFNCTADPAGWDPIGGKSPVHFAGEIHAKALEKAIKKEKDKSNEALKDRENS